MVSAMQILAVYGGVQSINDSHRTLFQGAGVPRYGVISNCIRIAFMGLLIYPLTARWGITGAAAATTIPGLLIQPYNISRLCRIMVASFKSDFLVAVGPPLLCACAMMAAVYAFRSIVAMNVYVFFLTVVFGGITYLVGIVIVSALLGRYNPIRDLIHIARRG
jgi:PST family polysaccharide transporter/lipopolysaccharide exporter